MKNGVPFDTAFALCDVDFADAHLDAAALAMAVKFGEFEGGTFDWSGMRWMPRDA